MGKANSFEIIPLRDLGPFQENCYLFVCTRTQEGMVVDPGDEPQKILAAIDEAKVRITSIFLTHTHIDHVLALHPVQETTGAKVFLPAEDEELYLNIGVQCQLFGMPPVEPINDYEVYQEGFRISVGEYEGEAWHTPGHSPGSYVLYFPAIKQLFAGDLLFKDGIGRTDLWGGDLETMQRSLKRVTKLPGDVDVLPGHGEPTTMGRERAYNPFLTGQVKFGAFS